MNLFDLNSIKSEMATCPNNYMQEEKKIVNRMQMRQLKRTKKNPRVKLVRKKISVMNTELIADRPVFFSSYFFKVN